MARQIIPLPRPTNVAYGNESGAKFKIGQEGVNDNSSCCRNKKISDDRFKSRTNLHGQEEGAGSGSGHAAAASAACASPSSSPLQLTQETLEATDQDISITASQLDTLLKLETLVAINSSLKDSSPTSQPPRSSLEATFTTKKARSRKATTLLPPPRMSSRVVVNKTLCEASPDDATTSDKSLLLVKQEEQRHDDREQVVKDCTQNSESMGPSMSLVKIEQAVEKEGGLLGTGKNEAATKAGRGRLAKRRGVKAVAVGPRLPRPPRIRLIVGKRSEGKLVTDFAKGDGNSSENKVKGKGKEEDTDKERVKEGNHQVQVLVTSRPGPFCYKSSNEVIHRHVLLLKKRR
ncbi:hypothetical protein KI688_006315 [Linnemannia hyalina]|uniref:Uncharacterized protein n=1 Tax=Linnemannia hyalina TaxID=64524 RepID=A0A9P7Y631_9FUNG|nr:hypothetical protein KI688_006315 [Linnemannia hyalina]